MNNRIKELREQAWTLVSNEERERGDLYDAREQWERCDQKFAELIVRECVRVGSVAFCSDHSVVPVFPSEKIKEHFGVED